MGVRQGIPLKELEALTSGVGGPLAGALNAQLRGLAPTQSRNPSAEITFECFLTAVSGAVFSCESSGGAAAELRNSKASSSVMAEDMRTILFNWGVLGEGELEEVGAGSSHTKYLELQVT